MKVALIADALWLEHEAAMLRHLVVGLADESVCVVLVLPVEEKMSGEGGLEVSRAMPEAMPGAGEYVTYRASRWGTLRDRRVWGLRKKLAELKVDVLHAMDESLLGVALRLGRELGLPVVGGCWSMAGTATIARAMRGWTRTESVEASGDHREVEDRDSRDRQGHAPEVTLMGVTEPMVERLRQRLEERTSRQATSGGAGRVVLVRPGVMRVGEEVGEPLRTADSALCLLAIGDGKVDAAMTAFFQAVAKVRMKLTQMQIFLYSTRDEGHRWWKKTQEMGLLGQVCLVGPDAGSQRMLVQSDVVLLPQAGGMLRALMLTAMEAGRPVIAVEDAAMDDLIEATTARLLHEPTAESWAQALLEIPQQVDQLRALGERARCYIRQEHGIASYVNRVIEVYRTAVGGPISREDL